MSAYYNEFDPYAAQWLRNLIAAGHIAPGDVDERSIAEVCADNLRGYTQCHFFAGIGVWSHALRLAGWPDDRPVWTGSCPCQPFSTAGKRRGHEDERHLWPTWFRLIRELAPGSVFGEQVANGDGAAWLDHVATDLEGDGYAVGAVSAPACGFGAPHIRQRLYWVAHAERGAAERHGHALGTAARGMQGAAYERQRLRSDAGYGHAAGALADASSERRQQDPGSAPSHEAAHGPTGWQRSKSDSDHFIASASSVGALAHAGSEGPQELGGRRHESARSATAGFWSDAIWLPCRDGKARPTKPGIFPLAHGIAGRVGRLRAYGNAIVAPQAVEFIRAAA